MRAKIIAQYVIVLAFAFFQCPSVLAENDSGIVGDTLLGNNGENKSNQKMTGHETFILNGNEDVAHLGVEVSDAEKTIIDINVKGIKVEQILDDGELFQILTISDYATTEDLGKPQLPIIKSVVAIPEGASLNATVMEASYKTYSGFKVYPFQMPLADSENASLENASRDTGILIDSGFYSQDIFYPEKMVVIGTPGIWRDLIVVDLQINPVMFNPAKGELRIYDHIKVELAYEGGVVERTIVSQEFAPMYQSVILNYDFLDVAEGELESRSASGIAPNLTGYGFKYEIMKSEAPADVDPKYFLIRHDGYVSEGSVQPLLDWRVANGLNYVHGVFVSGYSPTPQDIKNVIESIYSLYPSLQYVVLVGDISYLPWYDNWDPSSIFRNEWPGESLPSDYWYGCISGNDLYPELAVGRLSVNNDAEAQQQINKILTYEGNSPAGSWTNRVLLVANDKETAYEPCKESIRTATYSNPFTFYKAYGSSGATNAVVSNAINDGIGIVNYRGHGLMTAWTDWNTLHQYYSTTEAQALNNGDKTPVVFSIACLCSALDHPTNCLGEAFVKDDDSAVAFLGATRSSWRDPNDDFDKYLVDVIGNDGIRNIGMASNAANVRMMTKYKLDSFATDNAKMYLWLGDPALRLWTSPIARADTIGVFRPSTRTWYLDYNNDRVPDKILAYGLKADQPVYGDWNGDGKDTIGVFRPSTRTWYLDYNNDRVPDKIFAYGLDGDLPVAGDWNNDGRDTVGVFRPSTKTWYLDYNNDGKPDKILAYGLNGDQPVAGDWNNDGKDTIGVFRPSTRTWYLDYNNDGKPDKTLAYGLNGDQPVAGDWNGDRRDTIGVFRSSTRTWYLDYNNDGKPDKTLAYGLNGDLPVAGDWSKDGRDTIGVFRPSTRTWYLDYNNDRVPDKTLAYGLNGDLPVAGDWNNDGRDTIGVFRPSTRTWYLDYNNDGVPDKTLAYGLNGDLPIAGDWNNDGRDTIGVFRPSTRTWYLDYNNDRVPDKTLAYGLNGDLPVAGDWNNDGRDTIGVFRPSTRTWYLDYNNDRVPDKILAYGLNGDLPVSGDWFKN
jgi:hypothetical protein